MDFSAFFASFIQILSSIVNLVDTVWGFLNNSITIGRIKLFGLTIFDGWSFTPINIIFVAGGGLFLTFIIMRLVKLFVPGG